MRNDFLLLELKRMRYKVKLAAEETSKPISEEDEDVVVVEEEGSSSPSSSGVLNWTGPTPDPSEWESEPPTKISIDPAKARERVKRYLATTDPKEMAKLTPEELDSMIEHMTQEEVEAMSEKLDRYHFSESEAARGMVPGSGGMMTEEARRQGLESLRKERPELFDPKKQEEMKGHKQSYFVYYEPMSQDERKTRFSEMMLASRGYNPVKLNQELADQLSGIIGEYLVGKSFTISTGSPTLPREETVTILDVDPDDQKIIFRPVGKGLKLFSSYDDFFYNAVGRKGGAPDGQRALAALAPPDFKFPQKEAPKKDGFLGRAWEKILRISPPWAKV